MHAEGKGRAKRDGDREKKRTAWKTQTSKRERKKIKQDRGKEEKRQTLMENSSNKRQDGQRAAENSAVISR